MIGARRRVGGGGQRCQILRLDLFGVWEVNFDVCGGRSEKVVDCEMQWFGSIFLSFVRIGKQSMKRCRYPGRHLACWGL